MNRHLSASADLGHLFSGLAICFFLTALPIWAGTTGKIAGTVIDAQTRSPLAGVNVMLEGTSQGAASDLDGHFSVINVSAGVYTLLARIIGYRELRMENVRVSIDLTTQADMKLEPTVLEISQAVTVVAERPMVVKDLTASTAVVGAADMAALPISEVSDAIKLQAGLVKDAGGGIHVRGGRSGEISYWIDGVPVTDMYDGGTVVDVNKDMVQELQVVSGAFNAEYGQAMSGIVNITTKEGSNKFEGSVSAYSGDYVSQHDNIFRNIQSVNPLALKNIEGQLQGPIVSDKLFFLFNGRYFNNDGWLYGNRTYRPEAVTIPVTGVPDEALREVAPEYWDASRETSPGIRAFQYVIGSNAVIDSMITYSSLQPAQRSNPDTFSVYYQKLRNNHATGRGDGQAVSMNGQRKLYAQGKLIWKVSSSIKLSYNFIRDDNRYTDFMRDYLLNPDGALQRFRTGETHLLQWTHTLSSKTFYKLGVSYFYKNYSDYVYDNPYDPRYVHPYLAFQDPYSFKTGGVDETRFNRTTRTFNAKFDLESQVSFTHLVKWGFEFRSHRISQQDLTLQPVLSETDINLDFDSPFIQTRVMPESTIYMSSYVHHPLEFSGYLQDKIELKNMIVNLGVRLDWFRPDGVVLNDPTDPSIYNPIKPQNRYHDYGSDGIPNTHDANGTEGNGIQDAGETPVTLAERQTYWYRKATDKIQISPRLGVSFPITDRGVIHFSYGHFFQIPRFERLYQNPDFKLGSGTGNVGVIGNTDLKPEQTVSGELGLQQQIGDDITLAITGYFRDIRNLAGTRADEIVLFGGSAKYSQFSNSDFGFVRGIILSVNKRIAGGFQAALDYTLQIAKGSNSDPEQARNALAGGTLPEVQLVPLDWDQRQTVNASLSYASGGWAGSLIAQWGTGLPYTPRSTGDITALLTNSQTKPGTFNVDFKVSRSFKLGPSQTTIFLRVFNLFDRLNELNVYNDTGKAGETRDKEIAQATNPPQYINSLDDWYVDPSQYSEPRRVEVGVTCGF
jgi:outer membrane receptor protein involved in Fe transport